MPDQVKPVWMVLGAIALVALLVALFFFVGGDGDASLPAEVPAVAPKVTPRPDGGVYRHPHPDRFRLRYSPHP